MCACCCGGGAVGAEREVYLVVGRQYARGRWEDRGRECAAAQRINAWMATSTTRIVSG